MSTIPETSIEISKLRTHGWNSCVATNFMVWRDLYADHIYTNMAILRGYTLIDHIACFVGVTYDECIYLYIQHNIHYC